MSDFLQFKDEVINGTPRYNISDNGDGTKSIELANEVVEQGTTLNKANFNKANALLGYNNLIYERQEIQTTMTSNANGYNDTSGAFTGTKEIGYLNFNGTHITTSLYGANGIHEVPTNYGGTNGAFLCWNSPSNSTNGSFKLDGPSSTTHIFGVVLGTPLTFENDIPIRVRPNYSFSNWSSGTATYYLNNQVVKGPVSWDSTSSADLIATFIPNCTFDKVEFKFTFTQTKQYMLFCVGFGLQTSQIKTTLSSHINKFTSEIPVDSYINNQVINVNTPNGVITSETSSNTFNDVGIDTLLQSNKYYELMFDEPNDRFIAYETRV